MTAKGLLNGLDKVAADLHLRLAGERAGVSIFLFHGIFENEGAIRRNAIFPQERMTIDLFRQFLDYFSSLGYHFVRPSQLTDEALDPNKNYALLTFDDGYFNNTLILDTLKEYHAPALLFVATAYVQQQKSFWSDVVYRERKKRGTSDEQILREIMALKGKKVAAIFDELRSSFGADSIRPLGDADRPLTVAELATVAKHPYIHIGNHTHEHEVLTNLNAEEISEEINNCQRLLREYVGYTSDWISYPNGSYNADVLAICKKAGFNGGITTVQQKNSIRQATAGGVAPLLLSRFNPVAVNGQIDYRRLRASFQLKTRLKQWLQ